MQINKEIQFSDNFFNILWNNALEDKLNIFKALTTKLQKNQNFTDR